MDFMNMLLMDDWLMNFVDNRLMMFMNYLSMFLNDNILVMFMDNILMLFFYDGSFDVFFNNWCQNVFLNLNTEMLSQDFRLFNVFDNNSFFLHFVNNWGQC